MIDVNVDEYEISVQQNTTNPMEGFGEMPIGQTFMLRKLSNQVWVKVNASQAFNLVSNEFVSILATKKCVPVYVYAQVR